MKKVILILSVFIGMSAWAIQGGEIGNGKVLRVPLLGVELTYPKNWSSLDMEYIVSLSSPASVENKEEKANYTVSFLSLEDILTQEDLKHYVENNFSYLTWQETELKGIFGFRGFTKEINSLENQTIQEFYLKKSGEVIRISYKMNTEYLPDIFAIHQSLTWLP
ncbi:MAG: hypothetical protein A2Z91_02730 [Deltaproteobacteria bacterium GWA2_38_16]|nr:MAG: hypothetical protein A2Z91_02730 [Deltaproteobacteria bacterium GWA2_38_16]OGQ02107.1 MAG: hypothetical protein A3D19_09030 [Deltaproteobacteria bacterium RIFCSPHIGHO2_02_FULL_38_15]OGQ32512.1 MAG: hypothetical protein A3A72_02910 [Deltaproteobacteria bacterium RIFCSPLOWO2_01_FULL_38_9]OGQ59654.1 MAG: hypothetical protein A3G92_00140 [Deltaproteobacteria bacterium RIFCSPLOWO2_12_FULL_38_8]HBQ21646.1 hypothetical protein [Deltaproteobacteria bacterium]